VTIRRVLCPTDFSETSRHAAEQAIAIAAWYRARIAALHVLSPLAVAVPGLATARTGPGLVNDADVRQAAERETAGIFAGAGDADVGVDVLIDVGQPTHRIVERASSLPADLIVMGTHGLSGFERFVLGSVAEKVLRKAPCPVLTVPPRAHTRGRLPFEHLLCGVDFSDSSLQALQFALSLAKECGASLTVLHVIEWPWEEPPAPDLTTVPREQALALMEFRRYSEEAAKLRLEGLVSGAESGAAPPVVAVRNGKAYVQILDAADEEHADLVMIGVRGRNALDRMVFGSTVNQVVRRASCPVLTLRP
jgi:nucleotide-binding universal stress UspA family protein